MSYTLGRSANAEAVRIISARRESRRERAAYQAKNDFSDISDSSPEQLAVSRRVGRPPVGKAPRQLIAFRVDPTVLEAFRKEARRRRVGCQTLINEVLVEHTRKDVA